jgi:hypothetical protein
MGVPELAVVVAIAVPILAIIWIVRLAAGLRSGQESIGARLDAIERTLQRQPPA